MTTGVALALIGISRPLRSVPLVALSILFGADLGCVSDAPEPPVHGGQTVDEGGPALLAYCTFDENYGPDQPSKHYMCRRDAEVPGWAFGDPTPAGTYDCWCDEPQTAETFESTSASSCEVALSTTCGIDLNAPAVCSDYQGACYPVRNQPGSWRCECLPNTGELSPGNYDSCREALVGLCGPPIVEPGSDAGSGVQKL